MMSPFALTAEVRYKTTHVVIMGSVLASISSWILTEQQVKTADLTPIYYARNYAV